MKILKITLSGIAYLWIARGIYLIFDPVTHINGFLLTLSLVFAIIAAIFTTVIKIFDTDI